MPKLINMWECIYCGQNWDSEEGAYSCERRHKPITLYEPKYEDGVEFPEKITVWFIGGISKDYYRE